MTDNNADVSVFESPAGGLRTMLDEAAAEDRLWSETDLGDVLRHQWAAPLAVDLGGMEARQAERLELLAASKGLLLRSFGDLMSNAHPPLALLELTKEFAKRCLHSPHAALPDDVARVMYFASIAAALAHAGRRISKLADDDIVAGIDWALSKSWVSDDARAVLKAGRDALLSAEGNVS